jgi:hypothetical protein
MIRRGARRHKVPGTGLNVLCHEEQPSPSPHPYRAMVEVRSSRAVSSSFARRQSHCPHSIEPASIVGVGCCVIRLAVSGRTKALGVTSDNSR